MNIWEFEGGKDSNAPQCYVTPTILTRVFVFSRAAYGVRISTYVELVAFDDLCGDGEELACLLLVVIVSTDCINCCAEDKVIVIMLRSVKPIPVAARSKTWVCGSSLAGNAGSNPAGDMEVSFEFCVLSGRLLCFKLITRPEESC